MATPVHDLELPTLDLMLTPREEAHAVLAAARRQHWLARGMFGYVVTHYDDVVAVLRDKRWHSAAGLVAQMSGVTDEEFLSRRRESILSSEGETHTRLRRLVGSAFSPRSADRLRPFMREVVNGLVDEVSESGRCDLVADVCEPYPIPIICELLGAPKEDWKLFSVWATDLLRVFNNNLHEDLPLIKKASEELDEYTRGLIAHRRANPADDLLNDMIAATDGNDRLTEEELVMMTEAVIVGGTDTTRNQLACSVALFTQYPDQWALLAGKPELASRAVEETMRVLGAVRATGRVASVDIEYRDVLFPKGTIVSPSLASANRDEDAWVDPDRFDITRESTGQPQLTFGSGIHYCLGAALARAELQEALPILATRLPDIRVDGVIEWKPNGTGVWGPERLPLAFTPTRSLRSDA
jgi:cytochrome P450